MEVGNDQQLNEEHLKGDEFYYDHPEPEVQMSFFDWFKSLPSTVLIVIFLAFILGLVFSKSLSTVIVQT